MDCAVSVPLYFLFFEATKVEWLGHKMLLLTCYESNLKGEDV